jgi:hypothetical protein
LTAVALSRISLSGSELYAEANLLKSNLRLAQWRALTVNDDTSTTWGIGLSANSYTLQKNGATSTVSFPSDGTVTHTLSPGVTISGPSAITYDYWGSPGAGDVTVTLTQAGASTSFTINRTTGHMP